MSLLQDMHSIVLADTASNDTSGLMLIVVVMLILALLAYGVSKMK